MEFLEAKEALRLLHESGLLFRINREVLHPLGLALYLIGDAATATIDSFALWDVRKDPEGATYTNATFKEGAANAEKYHQKFGLAAHASRLLALGYVVQPLPVEEDEQEKP